ncbi:glyoxalase/bleomycin resistance/dioxygenase family protein [Rhodococcoides fascians A21d2]|nr:glyoxalase/bleomycin resistance/dioxygenase family protein [Rhodococcus fascians A21d2]
MYPSKDIAAAVEFYVEVFGFKPKFVDGDRFAALDAGDAALALCNPSESVAGDVVAASIRVEDVGSVVSSVCQHGGSVIRPAEVGPHEIRAVVADSSGNPLILFQKL